MFVNSILLTLMTSLIIVGRARGDFSTDQIKQIQKSYCKEQLHCPPRTAEEIETLKKEAEYYTKSHKFNNKIKEAQITSRIPGSDARYKAILDFLSLHVLLPKQSVIDLGCAAGAIIRQVQIILDKLGGHGPMTGIELTPGWIEAAKEAQPEHDFFVGDVTVRHPSVDKTFDVILLNDVMEHIAQGRYGCLFSTLWNYSHPGTVVYMHVPTVATQINEKAQYFENIIPQSLLVAGMACAGFEMEMFEYDMKLSCGHRRDNDVEAHYQKANCLTTLGYPKYYHILFRRPLVEGVSKVLNTF